RDRRPSRWIAPLSIAAGLIVCAATAISYQRGHLRLTKASQESYIASISRPIASVMRVGLGDHVHCAVFRKILSVPPSFEQFTRDMGAEYRGLVPVVAKLIPSDFKIDGAHRCRY